MRWGEFISLAELGQWFNRVRMESTYAACTTRRGTVVIYTEWTLARELKEVRINGRFVSSATAAADLRGVLRLPAAGSGEIPSGSAGPTSKGGK